MIRSTLSKLVKRFTTKQSKMEPTDRGTEPQASPTSSPQNIESLKEEMIKTTSNSETSISPTDGGELTLHNKLTKEEEQEIRDSIGGGYEYDNMATWIAYYLPEDEEDTYNWIVNAGQVEYIKLAVAKVYAKYKADCEENEGLEEYINFCREINAVDNQYSTEIIKAFRVIRQLEVGGVKDYLQLARVMCSYGEYEAQQKVDEEDDNEKPNLIKIKYYIMLTASIGAAKRILWEAPLPHEMNKNDD